MSLDRLSLLDIESYISGLTVCLNTSLNSLQRQVAETSEMISGVNSRARSESSHPVRSMPEASAKLLKQACSSDPALERGDKGVVVEDELQMEVMGGDVNG